MSMKIASDTMFGGVLYMFLVAVVLVSSAKGVAVVLVCSANSKSSMLLLVKDHALTPRKRVNLYSGILMLAMQLPLVQPHR